MNQPPREDISIPPESIATAVRQIAEIHAMVTGLQAEWARFRPVAEAFQRGGVLAARTAARHARKDQANGG